MIAMMKVGSPAVRDLHITYELEACVCERDALDMDIGNGIGREES